GDMRRSGKMYAKEAF
ncbi:hypothetical protein EJB05_13766, partial [Eragrostis curvula]